MAAGLRITAATVPRPRRLRSAFSRTPSRADGRVSRRARAFEIAEPTELDVLAPLEHLPRVAERGRADDDRLEVVDLVREGDRLRLPRLLREVLEVGALALLPRERLVLSLTWRTSVATSAPNFSVRTSKVTPQSSSTSWERAGRDHLLCEAVTREDRGDAGDVAHVGDLDVRVLANLVFVPDGSPVEGGLEERTVAFNGA